ncbi:Mannosyl-D-glycerate transport/metabolism system repressor MngR [Enhygromyxa salina]|uniref:Mannosyl-D-glycerate transport/metabolism system repressor MngR n=1 Tax=Enhygromyxa salina TaxID=215803 RepID=A0A2S9XZ00_9BACT|nr:GntR family transcriptional regulator [Enhygromyxa salina]PRP98076.1 Mannosyl-D-glycerate transport/metabolism system repressor MngR [Enhygromyxa salina]
MGDFPDLGLAAELATRAPLCTTVADRLREAILAGELALDTELPSENALAERLGVSRPTVREAVRMLQAQGLVTGGQSVSTRRPRVTAAGALPSASAAMEALLRLHRVPLADLVQLRVMLEGDAFVEAARRRDPELLATAREQLDHLHRRGVGLSEFGQVLLSMHRTLVEASGNAAYLLVFDALHETIKHFLSRALAQLDDPTAFIRQAREDHTVLLELIEAGEGERARAELATRLRGFYERIDLGS